MVVVTLHNSVQIVEEKGQVMEVTYRIWFLYFVGILRNWFLTFSQHSQDKICCVHTLSTISLLWGQRFYFLQVEQKHRPFLHTLL